MTISTELLERLSTESVTAKAGRQHPNSIIELHHKDHPFTISFNDYKADSGAGTVPLTISWETVTEIAKLEGLTHEEMNTAYRSAKKGEDAPRKVNLYKASGKRLEKVYNEWFKYVNHFYCSYMARCIDIKKAKVSQKEKAETLLSKCEASNMSDYKHSYFVSNDFISMEYFKTSQKVNISTISARGLNAEQTEELFLLLDKFTKENNEK